MQLKEARQVISGSAVSTGAFTSSVTAGNLLVVWVWYNSATQSVANVSDTAGNAYAKAVGPTTGAGAMAAWRQELWYAKNVTGGAGVLVTATFTGSFSTEKAITAHEYAGADRAAPLDATTAAAVSGTNVASGTVTTTGANALVFGTGLFQWAGAAGAGFTPRSTLADNVSEDRIVSAPGSYNVTFANSSQSVVVQAAAFKAAGAPPPTSPDLTLTKQHSGSFAQGQTGAYTLTVRNAGSGPTSGTVTVTDGLPSGLTATALSGSGWNCALAGLTCTRADALAAGASYPPITLTVNVAATAPATVTNTATVSGGGDSTSANNAASDPTAIATSQPPGPSTPITFVQLKETRQAVSGSAVSTGALTSSVTAGNLLVVWVWYNGATQSVANVTDTAGNAYAKAVGPTTGTGAMAAWRQELWYAKNVTGGAGVSVTATFTGSFSTPKAITAHEYAGADRTAPLDGTTAAAVSGTNVASSTVTASGANALVFGTGLFEGAGAAGAGFTPRSTLASNVSEDRVVSTPGSYSVSFVNGSQSVIVQAATFKAAAGGTGPAPSPDLTLTKQHGGAFAQGQPGSYTLTVRNAGTSATSGTVTVTDGLPSGLTATALAGTGWNCTLSTLRCTRSDALSAGSVYPAITLTVSVAANAPATVTNTATVSGGGDTNSSNNSASDTTSIAGGTPGPITTPLRTSTTNPHYFVDGNGKAVYLTGSQTWNSFQDWGTNGSVRPLDFPAFVNFLTAHGHNFTLLWHIEVAGFCAFPTTVTSPPDFIVDTHPWQRTGPGTASDGGLKFDLTKFDQSYFDRLRSRVQQLNAAGIYAGVYTFTVEFINATGCGDSGYPFNGGNNINGISDSGGFSSVTMTAPNQITTVQDAFVEKVIDTLNDLPNVVWAISEEAPSDSTWWNAHQISHMRAYEATKPLQHPIGYPALSGGPGDQLLYDSNADWVAPIAYVSPTSSCGSGTPACKVNINDSDHSYFGMWNDSAQANRNFIWENLTNGNQVLFMDPYVVYYPRENRNLCVNPVNGVCSQPDARWDNFRDNMGYARTLANRMNLAAMLPQPGLVSTGFALANTNPNASEFVAYQPNSGSFSLNLSSTNRTLNVEWLNPATGATTTAGTVAGGATRTFSPPFSGDAVLHVYDPSMGTPDTIAPSAPTNVAATAVTASQISLTWTASSDNVAVAGYRVLRNGSQVGTSSQTSYSDSGLNPSTTYTYTVVAFDGSNNASAPSQSLSVTTAAGSPVQIAFVQLKEASLVTNAGSISTGTFASPVAGGHLMVVWVWYNSSTQSVASVTDTLGNVYARAVGPTTGTGTMASWRQEIWYGKNLTGGSGASVTATFTGTFSAEKTISAHEYAGADPTAPLDVTAAAAVTGANVSSGSATTTSPNELIFGASLFFGSGSSGSGFTQRSSIASNVSEDRVVSAVGSYAAAFVNDSQSAIVQMVTFRGGSGSSPPPPPPPGQLAVTPRTSVLTPTLDQQFGVAGGSGAVAWAVDGVSGGNATTGTITAGGLYTPPSQAGTHTVTATNQGQTATATVYVTTYAGTFTHHNDNARTGQNPNETVLKPANVGASTFGKLFSYTLDGMSMASPLYVAGVTIPGQGVHNVVYVATQHDSVYAFDADGLSASPLWRRSFLGPGVTTVPAGDTGECCDILPEIGITGTPVIDPATSTLYVVAKTKEGSTYVQRLHALDLGTGAEKLGGPVTIQASVPGNGAGASGGRVAFDPLHENQRPALLLSNGVVYIAFGSHGDNQPYHGWVLGYNAGSLQQVMAVNVSPNGEGGGIWQANGGPAADAAGNIYVVTGDGTFDANTSGSSFGDSFLKMTTTGTIADYFTPWNQGALNANNFDLGAAGPLLLPDQPGTHPHLLVSAGKNNTVYLVDRDAMGHYSGTTNDNQVVQSLVDVFPNGTPEPGNFSAPVYFNGTVYFGPVADNIQAFPLNNGRLSTTPQTQSTDVFKYPGATMAVSANGTANGILWAIQRNGDCGVQLSCSAAAPGVLKAYDASNLGTLLYSSDQMGSRDVLDFATKFSVPLVANGKVFVGSLGQLTVYGLLP